MYVAGMDCSWFRTPFLKHRFLVQSVEQIERLQRSNIHDIDPSRGLDVTTFPIADGNPSHDWLTHLYPSTSCTEGPPSGEMLAQELAIARDTRDKLARSVKTLFDEISKTGTPRPGPVNEAIQEITIVTRTLSTHATFMALSHGPQLDPSFNNHSLAVCTLTTIIGQTLGYDLMKLHELATGAPIA